PYANIGLPIESGLVPDAVGRRNHAVVAVAAHFRLVVLPKRIEAIRSVIFRVFRQWLPHDVAHKLMAAVNMPFVVADCQPTATGVLFQPRDANGVIVPIEVPSYSVFRFGVGAFDSANWSKCS